MRKRPWSRSCSEKKRRKRRLCLDRLHVLYLFCAFLCPRENRALPVSSLEKMAGTTRLELATSAVTGTVQEFYKQLQNPGNYQNTRKRYKNIAFCGLVLIEFKKSFNVDFER